MARGITPFIGLAVVVALALAAVFGSMSLANPAMAQSVESFDLMARPGSTTVTLTWEVPEGVTVADGDWNVRRSESEAGVSVATWDDTVTPSVADGSATLEITTLTNNTTYYFQVEGIGSGAVGRVALSTIASATPNAPPNGDAPVLAAVKGDAGEVRLNWTYLDGSVAANSWEYSDEATGDDFEPVPGSVGSTRSYTVTGLAGVETSFRVRAVRNGVPAAAAQYSAAVAVTPDPAPPMPTLMAGGSTPGAAERFTVSYTAAKPVSGLDGQIKLEMEDFGVPGSIDTKSVVIRVDREEDTTVTPNIAAFEEPSNPQDIETDDEEILIHLGDTNPSDDNVQGIIIGDVVTITIQSNAGVTLPTEGGDYAWAVDGNTSSEVTVKRKVSLDEDDGGRGDMLTATGKGFKNGTSIHFWLDANMNGLPDPEEFTLCSSTVGSNDVGSCEFEVAVPPFVGGKNYVNAIDGRSNRAYEDEAGAISDGDNREDHEFTLESSIRATPNGGTPGESMLVEIFDIPSTAGTQITKVELARRAICDNSGNDPCDFGAVNQGNASFRLMIPDWAPGGVQDLRVTVGSGMTADDPSKTVTISPPLIRSTPTSVVANQRVSLVGSGFNARAKMCDSDYPTAVFSFGGEDIDCARINGGDPVNVDNGGNWSASVDLPLDDSTVDEGTYDIRVRDSEGRTGTVQVTVPARTVVVTPDVGRVGTIAVVRGENWPGKNDEGDSFSIEIVYESANGRTTVSAQPDAGGRFESQIRIPTTAGIPSTNTIKVSYSFGPNNVMRSTAVTHQVPEGAIELSATSGGPGSTVTVSGEGFKSFVPINSVMIGTIEVTPSPRPSTDANGMMAFDVLIPGLDVGIQTVEVQVGQTTASKGFTVTESGVAPGDIKPVAEGLADLGTNLEVIWHFNNDTKSWTFYDGEEGSDLTHVITGETYLIQVKSSVEVILNRDTRSLTCVGGNCWNQIVW